MYKYTLHKHSTPTNAQLSNMNTRPITATKLKLRRGTLIGAIELGLALVPRSSLASRPTTGT